MRVRIGICLLALCWPLLATAAPSLVSAPAHACCRRDGAHHCDTPSERNAVTTVSTRCPQSGQHLDFPGARSARPAALVALPQSPASSEIVSLRLGPAVSTDRLISSSRAPPLA